MHLSTPSTRPKRKERHAELVLHWVAQPTAVAKRVKLKLNTWKEMDEGLLMPVG